MENMIYTSKKGGHIVFDDYVDNVAEYGIYYVEMCSHCHSKYKDILGNRIDDGGACGICSVKGCENEADYYVDFDKDEVEFKDGAVITDEIKNEIIKEVKLLEDVDDGVGIKINSDKGLFIQVVDYGEGKEYFIELNNVDENNVYEPCKEYNISSEFGNMAELIKAIELYLNN